MTRRVEPHDLLKYRFLSSPRFSPDGTKIAFTVYRADLEGNRYLSDIWLYDLASSALTQLTTSGADKAFCWNLDGTKIFFASERPSPEKKNETKEETKKEKKKGGGKTAALYSIGVSGGEALPLGVVPEPVTALWALPGDRLLLKTVHEPDEPRFEDADYMVFTQVPFCSNGKGFTGQRRSALALYSAEAFRQISPDGMNVGQVRLSGDRGRALAVGTAFAADAVMPKISGVWEFDLKNGMEAKGRAVLPQDAFIYGCAGFFQDGILVTGTDMKRHGVNENARFYFIGNEHGKSQENAVCLTPDLDKSLRNSVICDCRYGLSEMDMAFWTDAASGGDKAWFVSTDGYYSHLHTLSASGGIEQVTKGLKTVEDYDVSRGHAAVVGLEGLFLQELYLVENGEERRLTDFNRALFAECQVSAPEHVHLENGTDWGLDCWYMRPVDFQVGTKYPAIFHIHGGPKMTFGDVFVHEMQLWAAEGFAVLYCNPRGSDGKGNPFDDIRGKYGTIDYDDLMLFADWAVETLPFIDKDRMGVTGGSYGGYMTNWIIGHTDRFRAAVTQRSICNWVSKAGISDIGYYFVPDQMSADVWSNVDKLWWHSPLKYADRIKTPTLIIHSDEDHRCEISQGLQMFTALKLNGVESKMCVFKGENHELSRGGRPKPRLARLQEIARWFKERL
jgi:dipeptidyl aminopeptidase/acylaminoacyl peptidase